MLDLTICTLRVHNSDLDSQHGDGYHRDNIEAIAITQHELTEHYFRDTDEMLSTTEMSMPDQSISSFAFRNNSIRPS